MTKHSNRLWIALVLAALAACGGKGKDKTTPGGLGNEGAKIDRSLCEESGKKVETFDLNKDSKTDVWRYYAGSTLTCKHIDFDYDGKFDMLSVFDPASGNVTEVQRDTDFDGEYDVREVYAAGGQITSVRRDRNGDNKPDQWEQYSEATVAITYDDNYDGKVDRSENAPVEAATPPPPPVEPAPPEPAPEPEAAPEPEPDPKAKAPAKAKKPAKAAKPAKK